MTISFFEWLMRQRDRSDDVGELARSLASDPNAPTRSYTCLRQYICEYEIPVLDAAWQEFWKGKTLFDF